MPNSNTVVAGDNDADRFLMGVLRALADVVLIGAGVLRASPNEHVARRPDLSACRGRVRRAPREPRPAPGARDRGPVRVGPHRPRPSGAPRQGARADERPWRDTAREPTPRHCGRRLPRQAAAVLGRRDHRRPARARTPQDPLRSRPAHVRRAPGGGPGGRAVPDDVAVPRRRCRRGQPAAARRGRRPRPARRRPSCSASAVTATTSSGDTQSAARSGLWTSPGRRATLGRQLVPGENE